MGPASVLHPVLAAFSGLWKPFFFLLVLSGCCYVPCWAGSFPGWPDWLWPACSYLLVYFHLTVARDLWCLSFTCCLRAGASHEGAWHSACLPLGAVAVPSLPRIRPVFSHRLSFCFQLWCSYHGGRAGALPCLLVGAWHSGKAYISVRPVSFRRVRVPHFVWGCTYLLRLVHWLGFLASSSIPGLTVKAVSAGCLPLIDCRPIP